MKARRIIFGAVTLVVCAVVAYPQEVNTSQTPGSVQTFAEQQPPSTNIYKKETIIPEKKPVPYPYVREADVMWAKDIWRTIDLRQRQNFPLRYPIEMEMSGGERYSLFGLLMKGIETEEITPYEWVINVGWKDPFSKITNLNALCKLGLGDSIFDDNGEYEQVLWKSSYIWQFMIQEQWFFDKKHSTMNVRIVALAPVLFELFDEFGTPLPQPLRSVPFFVYFPQCRRLFATHAVYNPHNDAQAISFDDLFFQRRFASAIIAESNVYGNRFLNAYKTGQDILLEAERIKDDLFMMEHDLWEY
jgi:gliding motility associated protien GldN